MKKKSSGQALIEYAFLIVLVVLGVIAVLNVVSPAVGSTFHNAVDDTVNSDIRSIGIHVTQTVYAITMYGISTNTFTPIPPAATNTSTPVPPPASTNTFTPVPPPASTNTFTPTASATATATNTATTSATATPAGPWVYCADENGTCSFLGTAIVRYGENGHYIYKTFTNTTPCTNTVFTDPISGTFKHCYYMITATPTVVPSNTPTNTATATATSTATATATATATPAGPWVYCAVEGGTCNFTGTTIVRYGENGYFVYKTFTNTTACSNAVFGDPISGTQKHCYYMGVVVPTATDTATATATETPSGPWTYCADGGGHCYFVGTTIVRFGTNIAGVDYYFYQTFTDGTDCNKTIFGNPTGNNASKTCDFQGSFLTNKIDSVTATRNTSGNLNKVTVVINLHNNSKSEVIVTDSQSSTTGYNGSCGLTCTIVLTLPDAKSGSGVMTVSGSDFGTQTMSAPYLAK